MPGSPCRSAKARIVKSAASWLGSVTEEIRRVLEHLGLLVTRLIRLAYGPFQLGSLPEGEVEPVPKKVMQDQLGSKG